MKNQKILDKKQPLPLLPVPSIMIGIKVSDPLGRVLRDLRQPGHSWTRNFYNMALGYLAYCSGDNSGVFGAGYMSSKSIDGDVYSDPAYTVGHYYAQFSSYGIINTTTSANKGILVGTNDTAESLQDYKLGTVIANGTGSGQLAHVAMSAPVKAYTSGTKTWKVTHKRLFNNNSGAAITVKETGLYSWRYMFGASDLIWCIERTVLDTPCEVASGAQLTITYEIESVFPEV